MDGEYTDRLQGVLLEVSWRINNGLRTPEGPGDYVVYHWIYLGQSSEEYQMPNISTMFGSAISDDNERVISFFTYFWEEGDYEDLCCSVLADEVVKRRDRLC